MSKTPGERIAFSIVVGMTREMIAKIIDSAIRRAQEKAWDECEKLHDLDNCDLNPYRGKKK